MNNVDQIRDLIFGSQIKDFEEKFNLLNQNLKTTEDKINKKFNDLYTKLQRETERSFQVLEKKLDNFIISAKRERVTLKESIDKMDESLQEQVLNQKDEFATKIKVIKENIEDNDVRIMEDIELMKVEMTNLLKSSLASLADDKLSRDSMSQLLLDVAMKIQGTDVNTILQKGQKSEKK